MRTPFTISWTEHLLQTTTFIRSLLSWENGRIRFVAVSMIVVFVSFTDAFLIRDHNLCHWLSRIVQSTLRCRGGGKSTESAIHLLFLFQRSFGIHTALLCSRKNSRRSWRELLLALYLCAAPAQLVLLGEVAPGLPRAKRNYGQYTNRCNSDKNKVHAHWRLM